MLKTTNEEILDAVIRHQIFLLRYSGYVRNRINKVLSRSEKELAMNIRDRLRKGTGLNSPAQWKRLEALLSALDAIRLSSWDEATKLLLDEMKQLAYNEPIQLNALYTTPVPVGVTTVLPATSLLKSIALSRPFEGRVLKDWASTMAKEDIRRIHAAVQAGMVAGEDHVTIARRVVGTTALKGVDGVTEVTRKQVQAVVRTAVQHIANNARDEFFNSNKDLFTLEQFVATLDSRTSALCRGLDGKRYPVGEGPRPPLHFNCRSLRVAVVSEEIIGNRPSKPVTEKILVTEYAKLNNLKGVTSRDSLPKGSKGDYDKWARARMRSMIGPVPATTNYPEWLAKQSKEFQVEVLGVTKYKLFKDGGLKLDKFVDLNSGREFTLKELAAKNAQAFRAAGLDPNDF